MTAAVLLRLYINRSYIEEGQVLVLKQFSYDARWPLEYGSHAFDTRIYPPPPQLCPRSDNTGNKRTGELRCYKRKARASSSSMRNMKRTSEGRLIIPEQRRQLTSTTIHTRWASWELVAWVLKASLLECRESETLETASLSRHTLFSTVL